MAAGRRWPGRAAEVVPAEVVPLALLAGRLAVLAD